MKRAKALSLPTSPYDPWNNRKAARNKKASNKAYAEKRHFRYDILKRHQIIDAAVRPEHILSPWAYDDIEHFQEAITKRHQRIEHAVRLKHLDSRSFMAYYPNRKYQCEIPL